MDGRPDPARPPHSPHSRIRGSLPVGPARFAATLAFEAICLVGSLAVLASLNPGADAGLLAVLALLASGTYGLAFVGAAWELSIYGGRRGRADRVVPRIAAIVGAASASGAIRGLLLDRLAAAGSDAPLYPILALLSATQVVGWCLAVFAGLAGGGGNAAGADDGRV